MLKLENDEQRDLLRLSIDAEMKLKNEKFQLEEKLTKIQEEHEKELEKVIGDMKSKQNDV